MSKTSILIKKSFASALYGTGWIRRKMKLFSGRGFFVLMYHRVLPRNFVDSGNQAGMYVEPHSFKKHVRFLKKFFAIVNLHDAVENTQKNTKFDHEKPLCAITFDDGWYDFYYYAFPILKNYNAPASIFLPTDFIGTNKNLWTDRIGYMIKNRKNLNGETNNNLAKDDILRKIVDLKGSKEFILEKTISILKRVSNREIDKILKQLAQIWGVESKMPDRAFLNWDEVRELKQSGIISFGSHTVHHEILTLLEDCQIIDELDGSKKRLIDEKAVDSSSSLSFCYPNGNFNDKIACMVQKTGYRLSVTTKRGWNDAKTDPFKLRRIGIHQDMASTSAMFASRIIGNL